MLLRRFHWIIFAGVLLLPGCLVVTCGSTRTIPSEQESPAATPRESATPPQRDTSAGRW